MIQTTLKTWRNLAAIATIAVFALATLLSFAPLASAHKDPVDCSGTGVALSMTAYEDDGVTPIVGPVQSGQEVRYEATLAHSGGTNCNYEGGTLTIITPDGIPHTVASPSTPVVPLVESGVPFTSVQVPYVASEVDLSVGDVFDASASYTGGIAHFNDSDNTPVSAGTALPVEYQDVALVVTKTADTSFTEEYSWTVEKTVTPEVWDLFDGDTGTSAYTVTVTKDAEPTVSGYMVEGTITITNPAQFADAAIDSVIDELSDGTGATVDCGGQTIVPAQGFIECTYTANPTDDSSNENTVVVTTTGDVDGGEGTADVNWDQAQITTVNDTVDVDDSVGGLLADDLATSDTFVYTDTFACGADEGAHDNVVDLVGDDQEVLDSDNALVTVNCYDLSVVKTADTTFDREYNWQIDKTGYDVNHTPVTELGLATEQSYLVDYEITVGLDGAPVDSNWAVTGNITITNSHPTKDALLTSVVDELSLGDVVNLNCPSDVVPAAGQLVCTYDASLATGDEQTNTATATQQNYDYAKNGDATEAGTTEYTDDAAVTFGDPVNVTDFTIDVTDTLDGPQGSVSADDALPVVFTYSHEVGLVPADQCGVPQVTENTATYTSQDSDETDSVDWDVTVNTTCSNSCTLTQGYWKTHNDSFHGGAPTDEDWEVVEFDAEQTEFYLSGQSWFDVFWTAPKGNKYYNLAHQYMAAWLNVNAKGASTPAEVADALSEAETLFGTHAPDAPELVGKGKKGNKALQAQFTELAGILAEYNEGLTGPGHCDEDDTSDEE